MKALTLTTLAAACLVALTGCGSSDNDNNYTAPSVVVDATEITNKYTELANRTYTLQNEKQTLTEQIKTLTANKAELEKLLEAAKANGLNVDTTKLDQLNAQIQNLKTQLNTANQNAKTELTGANDAFKTALASQKEALSEQISILTTLKNTLSEKVSAVTDTTQKTALEEKIAAITEQLTTANQKLTTANAALTAAETAENKTVKLTEASTALKTLSDALKTGNEKAGEVNTALTDALKQEIETLKKKLPKEEQISITAALDKFKTNNNLTYVDSSTAKGFVVAVDGKTKKVSVDASKPIDQRANLNIAKINGISVTLLPSGSDKIDLTKLLETSYDVDEDTEEDDKFNTNGANWVGSRHGSGFTQLKFGVTTNKADVSHLFVYGVPLPNSKYNYLQSGTYRGSAIISNGSSYTPLPKAVTATLDLVTDKLNIDIKVDDKSTLKFNSDLVRSEETTDRNKAILFSGTGGDGRTEGAFFGANELGGFFEVTNTESDHNGKHGVFGASSASLVVDDYNK